MLARRLTMEMFSVGIIELLPIKYSLACTRSNRFNHHLMTNRAGATCIVSDGEIYCIRSCLFIGMMLVLPITGMSITEVPLIGSDVMLAGRSIVEIDG